MLAKILAFFGRRLQGVRMSTAAALERASVPVHSEAALRRRTTFAGIAGNVMEWYDFAVYGYFAPIIGRQFFPSEDAATSLIAAFGVFAAGFLMRPLGGLVFGHIGDRVGRKAALTLSVLAMAIPTFLIGVLPGHAQIGTMAAVLLVVLRMVQGLSVGGEYTTSVVFLVEAAPPGRRGLAGSWSTVGAVAGTLLGSAVGALISVVLPESAIDAWAWRLPFVIGLAVGLAGLYIREHVPEPAAAPKKEAASNSPVLLALRTEWRSMLQMAGLNVLNAVGFYIAFVYVVTYFEKVSRLSAAAALDNNTLNMIVLLGVIPAAGAISDRIGRRPVLLAAALAALTLAWPLFWLMAHHDAYLALLGQLGFALIIGAFVGVIPATMVEAFPARVRCSAVSIGYNVCLGIVGGTAPLVATWLIERTHDDLSPAYYIMAAASISLAVVWRLPEQDRPICAAGSLISDIA
jgi:MHS family proline/betaine transporter-like MFS transporter